MAPLALRALVLGAVSGGRSASGLAALALSTPRGSDRLHALASLPGTGVATLAAVGELVADKLPQTPSRLDPPALGARLVAGATVAGALARREGAGVVLPALLGTAGALVGTYAGAQWRKAYASQGPDWQAALAEDAAVLLLGAWAVRRG